MKNKGILALLSATVAAVIFAGGFFLGRSVAPSGISAVMHTAPAPTSAGAASPVSLPAAAQALPVNVNTADVSELDGLPGIGTTLAQRIVDYRNAYGPFPTPEALCNVPGIGEKTLEAILDFITVGGNA